MPAGCTRPSSPCSSSLPPSTPLILCCLLHHGVLRATSPIYSYQSSPRLRFVAIPINIAEKRPSNHCGDQVISPLLIIRRVANQSALTGNTIVTGSARFRSQGKLSGGSGTLPGAGEYPLTSVGAYGKTSGEHIGVGVETTIDLHRDKV